VLIQITGADIFGPFDLTFIGLQATGDDVHKGGFSLAVCAD